MHLVKVTYKDIFFAHSGIHSREAYGSYGVLSIVVKVCDSGLLPA